MGLRRRGEGGYIRIQNKSSVEVEIKIVEGRNVDDMGMDNISGTVAPGEQLPTEGKEPFEGSGAVYQFIKGEVRNRFQKDGFFHVQACPVDGSPPSQLTLVVDHNSWEARDPDPDTESTVKLVADVDEEEDSWKLELRIFDNYNPKKWMEEYGEKHDLGSKWLCHVGLPGTHDSGTYKFDKDKGASSDSGLTTQISKILDRGRLLGKLNDRILTSVFERLCKCQEKSIQEQLEAGIRYFDLRVAYHAESETFLTCHGVYCVDVAEILQQVNDFLSENSKEIVILEFKKLFDMGEEGDGPHEALSSLICDTLGDKLALRDVCTQRSTVQEFWDNGYQAAVLYQKRSVVDASEGKLWPLQCLESPWPDAGEPDELHDKLVEKLEENNGRRFFVVQGILTPDTDLIQNQIFDGGEVSIKSISKKCGCKVVDWVEEEWKPAKKTLNIVIVDFFENCSLLPAVINLNRA